MTDDLLQRIQSLQFQHKDEAEGLLLSFLREIYSADVVSVELRPLAVSLNSFNGFFSIKDGSRFFFKTHTEPDTVISEYYNASQLAEAGYPIIRPIFSSTVVGRQLLIYDVIDSDSVFDVAWSIENGNVTQTLDLTAAQNYADKHLFELYCNGLKPQAGYEAALSPIHQLFYHRLTGGRLQRFYGEMDRKIALPNDIQTMSAVMNAQWVINGQVYDDTLEHIISRSIKVLEPKQDGVSVIGHGDAHNGNVFYQRNTLPPSLLYFDPAFAGRHQPLLDLAKPLFHNVFAMWMYFPEIKRADTTIIMRKSGDTWIIDYNYYIHPIRKMFLDSKITYVLVPMLKKLKADGMLPSSWRTYLKSALFCCPFLTMNLTDTQKFSPEISLLGLAMSVEMGAESRETLSLIDTILNQVENQIA